MLWEMEVSRARSEAGEASDLDPRVDFAFGSSLGLRASSSSSLRGFLWVSPWEDDRTEAGRFPFVLLGEG
jgi:hypothetical protein